jgi:sorbitol-specific phosphotransferase system component IIA
MIVRKYVLQEFGHLLIDVTAKKREYQPGRIEYSGKAPISGK